MHLTTLQIQDMCLRAGLNIQLAWTPFTRGAESPTATKITVWFTQNEPEVWCKLMTSTTDVPVTIFGTRESHPSGSLDDRLLPCYADLLPEVNERRKAIGLDPVHR